MHANIVLTTIFWSVHGIGDQLLRSRLLLPTTVIFCQFLSCLLAYLSRKIEEYSQLQKFIRPTFVYALFSLSEQFLSINNFKRIYETICLFNICFNKVLLLNTSSK